MRDLPRTINPALRECKGETRTRRHWRPTKAVIACPRTTGDLSRWMPWTLTPLHSQTGEDTAIMRSRPVLDSRQITGDLLRSPIVETTSRTR